MLARDARQLRPSKVHALGYLGERAGSVQLRFQRWRRQRRGFVTGGAAGERKLTMAAGGKVMVCFSLLLFCNMYHHVSSLCSHGRQAGRFSSQEVVVAREMCRS